MTKSIAILITHGNHLADIVLDINLKDLIEGIHALDYYVSKLSFVQSEKNLIIFELKNLLKQNDFVLLIDKLQTPLTFRCVQNVFNFQEREYSKLLIYDNHIKLKPVIYLSRLFIIQDLNLKLVLENILKDHLVQFNKGKIFSKDIKLNSLDLVNTIEAKYSDVKMEILYQYSIPTIQLQSSNFKKLMDYESFIQKKLSDRCCPDIYSLEDSYDNRCCFTHIEQATQVSRFIIIIFYKNYKNKFKDISHFICVYLVCYKLYLYNDFQKLKQNKLFTCTLDGTIYYKVYD